MADHAAAIESACVRALAVEAAQRAAKAAHETSEAARLSLEAAQRADRAARETAEAANVLNATTSRDQVDLDAAVVDAATAETDAKDAFHEAQRLDFPKDPG